MWLQCEVLIVDPLLEDSGKRLAAQLLEAADATDATMLAAANRGAMIPAATGCRTATPGGVGALDIDAVAATGGGGGGRFPPCPAPDGAAIPLLREARAILLHERQSLPLPTVVTLLSLFVWIIFTDVVKDFSACGGVLYWALVLSVVPVVTLLMAVVRRVLIHNTVVKQQVCCVLRVLRGRIRPCACLKPCLRRARMDPHDLL